MMSCQLPGRVLWRAKVAAGAPCVRSHDGSDRLRKHKGLFTIEGVARELEHARLEEPRLWSCPKGRPVAGSAVWAAGRQAQAGGSKVVDRQAWDLVGEPRMAD